MGHREGRAVFAEPRTTKPYDRTKDAIMAGAIIADGLSLDARARLAVPPVPAMPVGPGGIRRILI
jgi:hypothetical protein